MNREDPFGELLMRHLDGRATPEERAGVAARLRADPGARAFLREVAEQSVVVADIERTALGREQALRPRETPGPSRRPAAPWLRLRRWKWGLAAAVAVTLLAVAGGRGFARSKPWVVRVAKTTGSSQFFGSRGELQDTLESGLRLSPGDSLETRSCDAWVELDLRDGSRMTIGGRSLLRVLDGKPGNMRFYLVRGSLWASPARPPGNALMALVRDRLRAAPPLMEIDTPTLTMEAQHAQFDLQTSVAETMLRVNKGEARVRQHLDGSLVELAAGQQANASLARHEPLSAQPQPEPVAEWACDLQRVPEVILGRWLPPSRAERPRLGAQPLLWPVPGREPVMLYAVALSVASSSDRPVRVGGGAVLRFRGRTARPQTVRFGFSTQKMRGVFAGKFELDVKSDTFGATGQAWEIRLPVSDFHPRQPQLSLSPEGLELTDVYALTIKDDAGLEINQIELLAGDSPGQSARR